MPKKKKKKKIKLPHNGTFSNARKVTLKILNTRLQHMWIENFQMYKLDLEKVEEPEIKLQTSLGHRKHKIIPEELLFLLQWLC